MFSLRTIPHPLVAAIFAVAGALSACTTPPALHANLLDRDLHARLDTHFDPGMTLDDVHTRLDELNISRRDRFLYEADDPRPPQLLARLFVPGGRFITQDDQTIEWVDTWFVFGGGGGLGEGGTLSRWYTRRGGQRYFHGEPIFAPPVGETAHPTRRYPFDPPPPAVPPEAGAGADVLLPIDRTIPVPQLLAMLSLLENEGKRDADYIEVPELFLSHGQFNFLVSVQGATTSGVVEITVPRDGDAPTRAVLPRLSESESMFGARLVIPRSQAPMRVDYRWVSAPEAKP